MSKSQLVAGYGPYRVDKDGVPLFNDVVRDFLSKCNISAEDFGKRLGRLTRQQPYSKGRISQMLKDNSFPDEQSRRWVIAKLLQIPPALMGVETLDDLLVPIKQPAKSKTPLIQTSHTIPQAFDIKEYQHSLKNYWLINYTNIARLILKEIDQRIAVLEQKTLYGEWKCKERVSIIGLLCGYHMVFASIARDQECYDPAISHLNKAYQLAKNYKLVDTQAAILCRRGEVYNEQGYGCENALDLDSARRYFSLAKHDFLVAKALENKLYPGLRGRLQLNFGLTSSHLAVNPSQLHQAILETEKVEAFIGKEAEQEDVYFVMLDEERYHLDLASVYLNAPIEIALYPREARRELRNTAATRNDHTSSGRQTLKRQAFETILRAKSYLIEKEYEEATNLLGEALTQSRAVNSKVLIARIASSCHRLLTTDYGKKSVDVAELEVALMTMQHPEFFQ